MNLRQLAAFRRELREANHILSIMPERYMELLLEAQAHFAGDKPVEKQARTPRLPRVQGGIAVIPMHGPISFRGGEMMDFFGGASTMQLGRAFDAAMNSSQIEAVLFEVDSPGGTVTGVEELTDKIHAARGKKPIVAHVNALMASAAFWIGSAADQIVATPSAEVGSVGVFLAHEDCSQMLEDMGVKMTLISAGKFKVEANPFEALSDETKEHLQQEVDQTYEQFLSALARNRGVTKSVAKKDFGEGRTFDAVKAQAAGMIDRVASFEDTLRAMGHGTGAKAVVVAQDQRLTERLCAAWAGVEYVEENHGDPDLMKRKLRLREEVA